MHELVFEEYMYPWFKQTVINTSSKIISWLIYWLNAHILRVLFNWYCFWHLIQPKYEYYIQLDTKVMQKRPDECKTDLDGQVMHLQRLKSKVVQYIASTKQL